MSSTGELAKADRAILCPLVVHAAALLTLLLMSGLCIARSIPVPVPPELRTGRFTMTVDGRPADLAHAAENYYFANLELRGKATISLTAPTEDYWQHGVEVQPWRENIRPRREGRTITFTLRHPAKLSISRPGDHLGGAEMIFFFANAPEVKPPQRSMPGLRYYGPGIYRENIDARSGESIYLAPGAVVFGSVNLWSVDHVRIFGRGTVVYDGPQDPTDDDGWMHKPNWHVLVMHNAHHVDVEGVTFVTRSRTWMIQMRNSRFIRFDNVKVIGACAGNANQDGMDWLGGGDTLVHDSFFRAADDIFALQGNWEGYDAEALAKPGEDVTNIRIDDSVLSTSISNIVRVNWPHKTFNSSNFVLTNSDVIHMGVGGCGVPFALFELWADPDGRGVHTGYLFDNIRLEDWYSLAQVRQLNPLVSDVTFRNIWALESPQLVPSVLEGDVEKILFDHVSSAERVSGSEPTPLVEHHSGATAPIYTSGGSSLRASFKFEPSAPRAGERVQFDASASGGALSGVSYTWYFGDGATAHGQKVGHTFRDPQGTLLDGSGRFRVLLKMIDAQGHTDWSFRPVVVAGSLMPAVSAEALVPGVAYRLLRGRFSTLADVADVSPTARGVSARISLSAQEHAGDFAFVFEGFIRMPADGGYTFTELSRDGAQIEIDGRKLASNPPPWPQVCGSIGNAVQITSGTVAVKAGLHRLRVFVSHHGGPDAFAIKWQGPSMPLQDIPARVLSHAVDPAASGDTPR